MLVGLLTFHDSVSFVYLLKHKNNDVSFAEVAYVNKQTWLKVLMF